MSLTGSQSYRLEDFAAARQLYADLATAAGEEESDVRINGRATDAQLEWARQGHLVTARKASREDFDAFETVYNVACGCIGRGELGQAGLLLRKAQGRLPSGLTLATQLTLEEICVQHPTWATTRRRRSFCQYKSSGSTCSVCSGRLRRQRR